jgi:RNA-binding protein with serine-rich domain 1
MSSSPHQSRDVDMDVDNHPPEHKSDSKVVIVNNLTRNVVESHLRIIFGFYGEVVKIDLPLYGKCV